MKQPQEAAPAADVAAEAEPQQEPPTQGEQPPEGLPASVAEAFAQALEDVQAAGEPVAEIAEAIKKPARKGKSKKGAAATEDEGK